MNKSMDLSKTDNNMQKVYKILGLGSATTINIQNEQNLRLFIVF